MIHYEIKSIKAYVKEEFLYDGDKSKTKKIPCDIFCISFYPGEAFTFGIMLEEGSVFYYIPPHALSRKKFSFDLRDLVYHNVPNGKFCIKKFKYLDKDLRVYMKFKDKWFKGKYIFTIDWYEGNDLVHFVEVNGQFAFLPSHKIKFRGKKDFLPFKKIHSSWSV